MANINANDVIWDTEVINPSEVQWDTQEPKPNIFGQLRQSFQETGKGLVGGIVNPLYRTSAHTLQGIEGLLRGGRMTTYRNPITGDIVEPVKSIPQAIGNALQTSATVLSPGMGAGFGTLGAMYGAGQAMEEEKSPIEIIKGMGLGGLLGKGFGLMTGEPILTGRLNKFARDRLARSAIASYRKTLGPTTKFEKSISQRVLPRLVEEKPFVFTRKGLLTSAERKQNVAGEMLDDAYANLSPSEKIPIRGILDDVAKAQEALKVNGVLIEQNQTEHAILETLKSNLRSIAGRGKVDPISLREYRQQLDSFIAARKKGFALSDADSSALNARRIMANSIRKQLAERYPDIAKLNAEFSYQNNLVTLLESTVQKQKNILGDVGGIVGEVAGNRTTGIFIRNLGSLFNDNIAWNSLMGSMKSRLASNLAKGNIEAANYSLISAMKKWNDIEIKKPGRKPLPIIGTSQDEYLGSLWSDMIRNQTGEIPEQVLIQKNETLLQNLRNKLRSEKGSASTKSLALPGGLGFGAMSLKKAIAKDTRTLGEKNNNPINLKAFDKWQGMTGKDSFGHAQFDTLESGIRAGLLNLRVHQLRNPDETLRAYMRKFKTAKGDYQAEFIAKALDISPDIKLKNINVSDIIIPLAKIESKIQLTKEQIDAVKQQFKLEW